MRSDGREKLEDIILPQVTCDGRVLFVGLVDEQRDYGRRFWPDAEFETMDIDSAARATYTADICNPPVLKSFDLIVVNGVLEQTDNPLAAIAGCKFLLAHGGRLFISGLFQTPEYHCSAGDKWRFTVSGMRALLSGMDTQTVWNVGGKWLYALAKKS